MLRHGPRTHYGEGSPQTVISGLNRTALALADYASPAALPQRTQDSLLVAGQALPDGIGYPQGFYERFSSCFLHLVLLSQAFLAQSESVTIRDRRTNDSMRSCLPSWCNQEQYVRIELTHTTDPAIQALKLASEFSPPSQPTALSARLLYDGEQPLRLATDLAQSGRFAWHVPFRYRASFSARASLL